MKTWKLLSLFGLSLLLNYSAPGQVSINALGSPGAYTQDFLVLTPTTFPLTDNMSIPGVYAFRTLNNAVPNPFVANNGSDNAGAFRNYGTTGAADRALGSLASDSTGTMFYGIRFQNDTATTIASAFVSYVGEQWRAGNTNSQVLSFSYLQSASDINDLTTGTYTSPLGLDFTTPNNTTVGAIDGNLAGNRVAISDGFAVTIPPGQEIMLRWSDINNGGSDHGLSIDDVRIVFRAASTAADAIVRGRVVTADGPGISKARIVLTGGDLTQPVYALTNQFGYYVFEGLESGRTYAATVSSKRYSFASPTRTIDLSDSALEVDFIAEP